MRSTKASAVPSRAHEHVQTALWAGLFAFIGWFAIFTAPGMPARQADYQTQRALELATENAQVCAKLNFVHGSRGYDRCMLDIGEFRLNVERRLVQETEF